MVVSSLCSGITYGQSLNLKLIGLSDSTEVSYTEIYMYRDDFTYLLKGTLDSAEVVQEFWTMDSEYRVLADQEVRMILNDRIGLRGKNIIIDAGRFFLIDQGNCVHLSAEIVDGDIGSSEEFMGSRYKPTAGEEQAPFRNDEVLFSDEEGFAIAADVYDYHDSSYERKVHALLKLDSGQVIDISVDLIPYDDCDTCYRKGEPCSTIDFDNWIGMAEQLIRSIDIYPRMVLSFSNSETIHIDGDEINLFEEQGFTKLRLENVPLKSLIDGQWEYHVGGYDYGEMLLEANYRNNVFHGKLILGGDQTLILNYRDGDMHGWQSYSNDESILDSLVLYAYGRRIESIESVEDYYQLLPQEKMLKPTVEEMVVFSFPGENSMQIAEYADPESVGIVFACLDDVDLEEEEGVFFLLSEFHGYAYGMNSEYSLYYFEHGQMQEAVGGKKLGPIGIVQPKWEDLFDRSVLEKLDSLVLAECFQVDSYCSEDGRTIYFTFNDDLAQDALQFEMGDPEEYDKAEKDRWKLMGMNHLFNAKQKPFCYVWKGSEYVLTTSCN